MTSEEKRSIILEELAELKRELLKNVDKLPDEWEPRHVREYVYQKSMICLVNYPMMNDIGREVENEMKVQNI